MDIENLIIGIKTLIALIFPFELPEWVYKFIWVLIAFILLYLLIAKIIESWKSIFAPIFYNSDQKRRNVKRRRFARYISNEISRLDRLEEWSDYRFAELEAEVEAEGRWGRKYILYPFKNFRSGLRREKSLSRALELSHERLVLLEGDPGAGKSVALRYLTQKLADRASNSQANNSTIPLYINLRGLEHQDGHKIDREYIYTYILKSLNRANDRDIEEFLEVEFDRGIEDGSWLFLFDSFDEIPEILSSTESDLIIQTYGEAITDFLHGMNQCRGVVASRYFHGPSKTGWPKFRILPLSNIRQVQLIRKAELKKENEVNLISNLQGSQKKVVDMSSNPMFLGLLCEHIRAGNEFPQNIHVVFETFIALRFNRDRDRLLKRFGYIGSEIRLLAEKIAFCMTADEGLGLTPSRKDLAGALIRQGLEKDEDFHKKLDALEFLKLAKSESETSISQDDRPFSFSHRRFQEYFTTCVILREPNKINPRQLLMNARWREVCVTFFQTQSAEAITPLLGIAEQLLREISETIPNKIVDPINFIKAPNTAKEHLQYFSWPSRLYYLLDLLQDGFWSRSEILPNSIHQIAGSLILTIWNEGTLLDRKWALEIAGILSEDVLQWLLEKSFSSNSIWLQDVAYRQTAKLLHRSSEGIERGILQSMFRLLNQGRLSIFGNNYSTISTSLKRLPSSKRFLASLQFYYIAPLLDFMFIYSLILLELPGSDFPELKGRIIFISAYLLVMVLWLPAIIFNYRGDWLSIRIFAPLIVAFAWGFLTPFIIFITLLLFTLC